MSSNGTVLERKHPSLPVTLINGKLSGTYRPNDANRIAYECYLRKELPDNVYVRLKSIKGGRTASNLEVTRLKYPIGFKRHPVYRYYGILNGKPYSLITNSYFTSPNFPVIDGERIFVNAKRFVHECETGEVMADSEFIVDDLYGYGQPVKYKGRTWRPANETYHIYRCKDEALLLHSLRILPIRNSKVNIGTRVNPVIVPISDQK